MLPGTQLAVAMWAMTVLSLALVALRLYTRIFIVHFVGAEDYMFAATGLFFVIFTAAIQVAVHTGLGQSFWSLSLESSSNAIFWTYVANTFAITGNAMAKLSMGLFLLRVVQLRWHKIALWALVAITASTSGALTIMLWDQTTPVKTSWDPFRTPGTWNIKIQPMSVGLGVWSSACDFFFAAFPWLFIWSLRVQRREKIMLAGSMSLGVIAGVCGIIRTIVLARLNVLNYTLTFVTYFAWAGAEIAVAMVCLGLPTLRPLYLRHRGLAVTSMHPRHQHNDALPQFTMCAPELVPVRKSLVTTDIEAAAGTIPSSMHTRLGNSAPESVSTAECLVESTPRSTPDSIQNEKFAMHNVEITPMQPARVYAGRAKDSVDEILGLYGQSRSQSRGPRDSQREGQIWIKNEVFKNRPHHEIGR